MPTYNFYFGRENEQNSPGILDEDEEEERDNARKDSELDKEMSRSTGAIAKAAEEQQKAFNTWGQRSAEKANKVGTPDDASDAYRREQKQREQEQNPHTGPDAEPEPPEAGPVSGDTAVALHPTLTNPGASKGAPTQTIRTDRNPNGTVPRAEPPMNQRPQPFKRGPVSEHRDPLSAWMLTGNPYFKE